MSVIGRIGVGAQPSVWVLPVEVPVLLKYIGRDVRLQGPPDLVSNAGKLLDSFVSKTSSGVPGVVIAIRRNKPERSFVESVISDMADKQPWVSVRSQDGRFYYWDRDSGETTWVEPNSYVNTRDPVLREIVEKRLCTVTVTCDTVIPKQLSNLHDSLLRSLSKVAIDTLELPQQLEDLIAVGVGEVWMDSFAESAMKPPFSGVMFQQPVHKESLVAKIALKNNLAFGDVPPAVVDQDVVMKSVGGLVKSEIIVACQNASSTQVAVYCSGKEELDKLEAFHDTFLVAPVVMMQEVDRGCFLTNIQVDDKTPDQTINIWIEKHDTLQLCKTALVGTKSQIEWFPCRDSLRVGKCLSYKPPWPNFCFETWYLYAGHNPRGGYAKLIASKRKERGMYVPDSFG